MAATKAQRIGIWTMAVLMLAGTIVSFVAIIFANNNQQSDQQRLASLQAEYQAATEAREKLVTERNAPFLDAAGLSAQYFGTFSSYQSRVGAFDKDAVTELGKEDLKVGDGAEIGEDSTFVTYYLGWNPDGKVFDGSIEGDALKAPFIVEPGSVIKGWTQGAAGMKVGGVRELSIPASLAYGEKGSGTDIAPNTPIKFVVMVIAKLDPIPAAEIPEALLRYYQTGRL